MERTINTPKKIDENIKKRSTKVNLQKKEKPDDGRSNK